MTILGIKFTHDSAVALIDNGILIFSYEMEKINNFPRYSSFCITVQDVENILKQYGYNLSNIDKIVIDGWSSCDPETFSEDSSETFLIAKFDFMGETVNLTTDNIAGYGHLVKPGQNIIEPAKFIFNQQGLAYNSYLHVAGHVASAYCSSPFSVKKESSFILVWDGGMPPQVFYYDVQKNSISTMGFLFPLMGNIYIKFCHSFKPFSELPRDLSVAGKAMAYMAIGEIDNEITQLLRNVFLQLIRNFSEKPLTIEIIALITRKFVDTIVELSKINNLSDADVLSSFQSFIQEILVEHLTIFFEVHQKQSTNLCFTGGCALNIKWNHSIRNIKWIQHLWVPPFPNDSGNAIGTACCEMLASSSIKSLKWQVYSGPRLLIRNLDTYAEQYLECDCLIEQLAEVLFEYGEPVVFLNGPAELGPRALGNRSILSPATTRDMKIRLNEMKKREQYRPVAPICLEEFAPMVFSPGSPDPFMLFEHDVRDDWKDKVPAVCHLDGSARLQTINKDQNHIMYRLLKKYFEKSKIPLLCNTSANSNGHGFFPDVRSAMKWNKSNLIWSENRLYIKKEFAHCTNIQQMVNLKTRKEMGRD